MTSPTKRPTARQIVRDDAEAFGWEFIDCLLVDLFRRDGIDILVGWRTGAPNSTSFGSFKAITGGKIVARDESHMAIITARQWLRGSTDLCAPAPARTHAF